MGVAAVALATVLLLPLLPAAAAAQASGPPTTPTREQAREDLARPDPQARRRAVVRLGETGTMADVPALVQALRDEDRAVRAFAERSLWLVWSRSGDAEVDALFARGLEQMGAGAADAALTTFSAIIARKPDFAEGWNKRATLHYLLGDYEKSLADCDEVMMRNPSHFGALSGYGQIYLRLGRLDQAIAYFERALAVNPNLEQVDAMVRQLRDAASRRRRDSI